MHGFLLLLAALPGGDEVPPSWLGGANATTTSSDGQAFGYPAPALDSGQRRAFAVGNAFFKHNWVAAPASTEGRDGLGPLFNARSCSSCHLRDGRGRPAEPGEPPLPGLLLRLGIAGAEADLPHPVLGGQLQDLALPGVAAEARVRIEREELHGTFGDGTPYTLERPVYRIEQVGYGASLEHVRVGPRVAPQLVGLGLLEAIPEREVLALADPEDADGDGISGRVPWVRSLRTGERALGRFGWKGTRPTVEEQVAAAFVNDIGITSSLFPAEALSDAQAQVVEAPSGGSPELSDLQLERVTFYSQVLAVPAQRDAQDPAVRRGRELFDAVGCSACHVPTWTTGQEAVIPAYAGQTIHPFTDLLLHDLGPDLADGKHDGSATGGEWRTPPLWGIGLFQAVNGHTRYLHDGRARDLGEAVLWHGGEAEAAREAFRNLPVAEREALLAFLASL